MIRLQEEEEEEWSGKPFPVLQDPQGKTKARLATFTKVCVKFMEAADG